MNKILVFLGGGLGDIFLYLHMESAYQSLAFVTRKIHLDTLCMCCNPASKDLVGNILDVEGNLLFENAIYKDFMWDVNYPDDFNRLMRYYSDSGYKIMGTGVDTETKNTIYDVCLIGSELGFNGKRLYFYNYKLTHQENEFFNSISNLDYIVVHPSGGLQLVDGITREDYRVLMKIVLDKFPNKYVVAVGGSHKRKWVDKISPNSISVDFKESSFDFEHDRFIDLTNKTSSPLCAKIVSNASCFIGTHSVWMNLFSFYRRPTICILSNTTPWGDAKSYVKTNGCRWMFEESYVNVVVANKDINDIYKEVIGNLEELP